MSVPQFLVAVAICTWIVNACTCLLTAVTLLLVVRRTR